MYIGLSDNGNPWDFDSQYVGSIPTSPVYTSASCGGESDHLYFLYAKIRKGDDKCGLLYKK